MRMAFDTGAMLYLCIKLNPTSFALGSKAPLVAVALLAVIAFTVSFGALPVLARVLVWVASCVLVASLLRPWRTAPPESLDAA